LPLFLLLPLFLSAQADDNEEYPCGVPDPTPEAYAEYRSQLAAAYAANSGLLEEDWLSSNSEVHEIPIFLFIFCGENEPCPSPSVPNISGYDPYYSIDSYFDHCLEYINEVFPENIQFYLCRVQYIEDDELANTSVQDPTLFYEYIHDPNSPAYVGDEDEDNAMYVYLNDGSSYSQGKFPEGIRTAWWTTPALRAHEFAHYFGLYHTVTGTSCSMPSGDCPGISLYPDNMCTDWCSTVQFECPDCPSGLWGTCTGDLISDTPPDFAAAGGGVCVGADLCDEDCNPVFCDEDGNGTVDPPAESYVYHPDYYNLMANLWDLSYQQLTAFTPQQKARMLLVLEDPNVGTGHIGGDMSFLIDDDVPECTYTPEAHTYFSNYAYFYHEEYKPGEILNTPLPFMLMSRSLIIPNPPSQVAIGSSYRSYRDGRMNCPVYFDYTTEIEGAYVRCSVVDPLSASYISCAAKPQFQADYKVNVDDIWAIQQHILQVNLLESPYSRIAADVNNSGSISTLDLVYIQRVILGLDEMFTYVDNWRFLPQYALDLQWNFWDSFFEDPFTAVWEYEGESRAYIATSDNPSYLHPEFKLYLPNSDAHEPETWSFMGIKSGDAYCGDCMELFEEENQSSLTVLDTDCLEVGDRVSLVFKSGSDLSDVAAFQLGLWYDTDVLSIDTLVYPHIPYLSLQDFAFFPEKGFVKSLWFKESTEKVSWAQGDTLWVMEATIQENGCSLSKALLLSEEALETRLLSDGGNPLPFSLEVEVVSGKPQRHVLKEVFPNPISTDELLFTIELLEPANVNLDLFDLFGGHVHVEDFLIEGEYSVPVNVNSLQPGIIQYVLNMGDETWSGILIKQQP